MMTGTRLRRIAAAFAVVLGTACGAHAATITVTSLGDSGAGSLRSAIAAAASGDTIDFAVTGTITLTTDDVPASPGGGGSVGLLIDKSVSITGPGISSLTIDGNGTHRIFRIQNVTSEVDVTLSGLTLTNAAELSSGGPGVGSAIQYGLGLGALSQGTLTIANCVISNCAGTAMSIDSRAALAISGTTFSNNNASGFASAIFLDGIVTTSIADSTFSGNSGMVAILAMGGTFDVVGTTFTNNDAGAISAESGLDLASIVGCTFDGNHRPVQSLGPMFIGESTFHANSGLEVVYHGTTTGTLMVSKSTFDGNAGAAIYNVGPLDVSNSTFTGNGAGIDNNDSTATISNCTIADNSSANGGGIRQMSGTTFVRNTIVAGNVPGNCFLAFSQVVTSQGYNLDDGNTCGFTATGDMVNMVNTGPTLGALASNGGATRTRALLPGSPAIDTGSPATPGSGGTSCQPDDQRSAPRSLGRCDIGAYESRACGNGVLDPGEECDDGNVDPNDGCTSSCTLCGNGIVTPPEQCDDGNNAGGDGCTADCRIDLDHFMCYSARSARDATAFVPVPGVSLVDAFRSTSPKVKKPVRLCNPANKLGEDAYAELRPDHLEGYKLGESRTDPPFVAVANQKIVNQFGTVFLDVIKLDALLVPTAKSLFSSPPAPSPTTDHFRCYKVKIPRGKSFKVISNVTVQDQFGSSQLSLVKPKRLCLPVDKRNESPGAESHAGHLLCYQTKLSSGSPDFVERTPVFTHNQFGSEALHAKKPRELCVPSLRNPS
jgi:cysteine-rich repeat protein